MAYFNHAFTKIFLGTGTTRAGAPSPADPATTDGLVITSDSPTSALATIGTGYFGFYDARTFLSINETDLETRPCCSLILASASVKTNDKQGPYHGGYLESNKSKMINPRYVSQVYRVDECTPQQAVLHIGTTNSFTRAGGAVTLTLGAVAGTGYVTATNVPTTGGTGTGLTVDIAAAAGNVTAVTINNPGVNYTATDIITIVQGGGASDDETATIDTITTATANCCKQFYCGEAYYIRIDVKGSPALRFANHQLYQTLLAEGGCCSGPTPTIVDPTLIYLQWANAIIINPYMQQMISPVVYDYTGEAWFATAALAVAAGKADTQIFANYAASTQALAWTDADPGCAGMVLTGAYVETKFGDCSFQITDFFEKEPVRILASEVDLNGDPCVFTGICVVSECNGLQGMGFGEQVLRDLILSESYLQNFFATDTRIREITQGNDILAAVNRNALYTRYYILHNVPRFNNPTGVFDNDQYMLEIITDGQNVALDTFLTAWLENCSDCNPFNDNGFTCEPCEIIPIP